MDSIPDQNDSYVDGAFTGCSTTGRNIYFLIFNPPNPVATWSKIWACGGLLTGIAGSKLGGMNICLLLWFCVNCKAEVSMTGRSLVQRNLTLYSVCDCDLDTSRMRTPTPTGAAERRRKVRNSLPSLNYTNIFRIWLFSLVFPWSLTNETSISVFLLYAVFQKTT